MFRLGRMVVSLLILLVVGVIAACSDSTGPTPIEAESAGALPTSGVLSMHRLAYCTPQPIASASALIGPAGGTIRAGKYKLTFPIGALTRTTLITMVAPRDTVNQVALGPEGLQFPLGRHPTLKMDYRHCKIPTTAVKRIVYTDDNLQARETLLTADNVLTGEVAGKLKHFSRYALMY